MVSLILVKWTLIYGDFRLTKKGRLDGRNFNLIINLMHKADASLRHPSEYLSPVMFLRGMAYQQFSHQGTPTRSDISRQAILFRHLDQSHRLRSWFIEQTGISIDDWIDLSFMLLAAFLAGDRDWISASYFDSAMSAFSSEQIARFLESVSRDIAGLQRYLSELNEERRRESTEFREQSPLMRFPLIKLEDKYYYYSIPLLTRSLGNFIYEVLRARDVGQFMDIFGPLFERYVKRGMDYLGEPYLTESEISRGALLWLQGC